MIILGIKNVDFDDERTNRHISGYSVYYGDSIVDGAGYQTNKVFIPTAQMQKEYFEYLSAGIPVHGVVGINGKISGFIPA